MFSGDYKCRIYTEFVDKPYAATLRWSFTGSETEDHSFRVNVDGREQYNITFQNESVPMVTPAPGKSMPIPWVHNGTTIITLVHDPINKGKFLVSLTTLYMMPGPPDGQLQPA
jgi:hypothetical protein